MLHILSLVAPRPKPRTTADQLRDQFAALGRTVTINEDDQTSTVIFLGPKALAVAKKIATPLPPE